MVSFPALNLIDITVDEIALEGLDGITIEALWLRLSNRLVEPLPLAKEFMLQVWEVILKISAFTFYKLKVPRPPLFIIDRYDHVDPDIGTILEPENVPDDIYPHEPINDTVNNIKGSCSTYYTRQDVTALIKKLSLDEVIKNFGQSLVIVASQELRNQALMGDTVCPTLDLTVMQYCFLERVGRSRHHGEVTQGKLSLNLLKEEPKSLFYHRKFLLHHKLITKQIHHQKIGSHYSTGSLLHLPRFFVERKPKIVFMAEEIIELLKGKDNYVAEYDEIKKKLRIEKSIKKLFKTVFFQKIVKTDIKIPYRMLYPNAEPNEWQQKNDPSKERIIRVVQLLNPEIEIDEIWNSDEIFEEKERLELNISNHKINVPYLRQGNQILEKTESEGLSQIEFAEIMGLTKLQSRTIIRNLCKANILATYMDEVGRQRLSKYVSKKYEKGSKMRKQFIEEVDKMKQLTENIGLKIFPKESGSNINSVDTNTKNELESDKNKESVNIISVEEKKSLTDSININVFDMVNKILHKYKLHKFRKYKYLSNDKRKLFDQVVARKKDKKMESMPENQFTENTEARSVYKSIKVSFHIQEPTETATSIKNVAGNTESNSQLSYRLLKRANIIIEHIKEHHIVTDPSKLMKMINEEEGKEGYIVKMDKKSLVRLLQKLCKDNVIKIIKIRLYTYDKEKQLTFISDPSIDVNDSLIQSAVEQEKIKFSLSKYSLDSKLKTVSEKPKVSQKSNNAPAKCQENTDTRITLPESSKYDSNAARRYGYIPKFVRMQTVHKLLYHLIYDHPGDQHLSKDEQFQLLTAQGYNISESIKNEMSTIYNTSIGWNMFIPPLPKHSGWPKGWLLMNDVILCIPLSLIVKIHNIPFVIPGIDEYLNHPIKKHYLIKDLPANIRNTILYGRKYVFSIHQTIAKLCYIGLVQFGPQRLKEKDQVFIYVNRNAELLDTTSSKPGYHKIENRVYPVIKYVFNDMHDVEKYWYDMWNICINTPLGGRLAVQGEYILLEDVDKKAAMIESMAPRQAKEAPMNDTGYVPGDRSGAAGIDSAMFAHLKRNWNWSSGPPISRPGRFVVKHHQRLNYFDKMQTKQIKFNEYPGFKKVTGPITFSVTDLKKGNNQHSNSTDKNENKDRKHEILVSCTKNARKSVVRRVMPRKKIIRSRVKYDEIDYRALQKMQKLRVDWDPHEDNILLVCKVAMMYLCPNTRKQLVTFTAVRDVLRKYSFISNNKTSRACQRRIKYMLRKPQTVESVTLGLEELKQNFYIQKRYGNITDRIKSECTDFHEVENRITEEFKSLVAYIAKKYYHISDVKQKTPIPVPKTVQEFNMFYEIIYPAKPLDDKGFTKDVRNNIDIHSASINSVIHSSMCCGKDREAWAYQLLKIYQQYPDTLLRNSMAKIRSDQMVTMKKNHIGAKKKHGNCMPMSSSQYQLSTNYIYKFQNKWPYNIFNETYDVLNKLVKWNYMNSDADISQIRPFNGTEIFPVTGGIVAMIHDYLPNNQLDLDIEIPDQIIMLDPRVGETDETYVRIAKRYQDILASFDQDFSCDDEAVNKRNRRYQELIPFPSNERREDTDDEFGNDNNSKQNTENCFNDLPDGIDEDFNLDSDEEISISVDDTEKRVTTVNIVDTVDNDKLTSKKRRLENKDTSDVGEPVTKLLKLSESNESEVDKKLKNDYSEALNSSNTCHSGKRLREDDDEQNQTDRQNKLVRFNESMNIPTILISHIENTEVTTEKSIEDENNISTKEDERRQRKTHCRVSDMIRKFPVEARQCTPYWKNGEEGDNQKRSTRLALLKMREELSDVTVSDNHHAHDFFVVNMFKIFYSLQLTKKTVDNVTINKITMPVELMPLTVELINKVVSEVSASTLFPKIDISYTALKQKAVEESPCKWTHIDQIYRYVEEKEELGATVDQLTKRFQNTLGTNLYDVVSFMTECRIFLRTGVTVPRYVHHRYVDPWLIRSCKIQQVVNKTVDPALLENVKNSNKLKSVNIEEDNEPNQSEKECSVSSKIESNSDSNSTINHQNELTSFSTSNNEDISNSDNTENCEDSLEKRINEQRRRNLLQQEQSDAAKQHDFRTAEEIQVVMKPWIRVDGELNRKVLDRMLGAILTYCITHPGVTITRVQNRFVPALQPFHTRELIEILKKLKCLEIKKLVKPRVTLFSTSTAEFPVAANELWIKDDEAIVEPVIGAVSRFSVYLGTNTCNTDFLL